MVIMFFLDLINMAPNLNKLNTQGITSKPRGTPTMAFQKNIFFPAQSLHDIVLGLGNIRWL